MDRKAKIDLQPVIYQDLKGMYPIIALHFLQGNIGKVGGKGCKV